MNVVKEVLEGRSDYGVGRSSLIIDRILGRPVVAMGAIFQNCPLMLLSKKRQDIQKAADLKQKKIKGVKLFKDIYSALKNADGLILATEWGEFRELDFDRVKRALKQPVIFDGRNIYDPKRMKEFGFTYYGVGR